MGTAFLAGQTNSFTGYPDLDSATFVQLTTSGTWAKPALAKQIYVEVFGAGGAGGSAVLKTDEDFYGGSGGGGGQLVGYLFDASELGSSISYTIGAGGLPWAVLKDGQYYGNPGGNTVFDTNNYKVTAIGGPGGINSTNSAYGGTGGLDKTIQMFKENGTTMTSNYGTPLYLDTIRGGASGGAGGGTKYSITNGSQGGVPLYKGLTTRATSAGASGSAPGGILVAGGGGAGSSANTVANGGNGGIGSGGGGAGFRRTSTAVNQGGTGGNGIIRLWWW